MFEEILNMKHRVSRKSHEPKYLILSDDKYKELIFYVQRQKEVYEIGEFLCLAEYLGLKVAVLTKGENIIEVV